MLRCVISKYNFNRSNLSKYLLNVFNLAIRALYKRTIEDFRNIQTDERFEYFLSNDA